MLYRALASLAVALSTASFGAAQISVDIGNPSPAGGSTEVSPGSWNVTAAGHDIWGSRDGFHFVAFEKNSDCTITAFIENWKTSNSWAKGGLMIRDSLDDNAAHATMMSTGAEYVAMQYRQSTGSSSGSYHTGFGTKRVWLRIVKEGNKVTGFVKREDEFGFSKFYTRDINFSGDSFFVGIAVTSHVQGTLSNFDVSSFEISDEVFSLPERDIGETGREIDTQAVSEGVWSIKGAGTDIGGTVDSFGFFNYKQSGDITATVHLDKLEERNINSKGGLMMRASHAADAPHVSLLTTGKGITMYYRETAGGDTSNKNVGVWSGNVELKLVKTGNEVACYYKHKSAPEWFHLGTATVAFDGDYYVGQAVTSAEYGQHATLYTGDIYINGEVIA